MDKYAELRRAFIELVGANPNLPIPGEVVGVEGDHCSVKIASGLTLTDVKLKATINDDEDFLLITPKKGSNVLLISLTGKPDNMAVIKIDKVEKFEYRQGGLVILADSADKKVSIKNNDVSLKEIFSDQAEIIRKLTVSTSTGPSGTPLPPTIMALEQWEIKVNKLLI